MPAKNESPAPSRILRPRPTTQTSKQHTRTFSTSAISPTVSQDGAAGAGYTPQVTSYMTTETDTPLTSPPVEDTTKLEDPSMVAVYGSVPSSPILKARGRGIKDSVFGLQNHPREWQEKLQEEESLDQTESINTDGDKATSNPSAELTPNSGRVIAIDTDLIYPLLSTDRDGSFPHGGTGNNEITLMSGSPEPISPTEKKGAVSGLHLALKQLHELGHPLHLVSARPASDRAATVFWLSGQGINIGIGQDDLVAALWFTNSPAASDTFADTEGDLDMETSSRSNAGDAQGHAKLKVLRAINAALYITSAINTPQAVLKTTPRIPVIQLVERSGDDQRNDTLVPSQSKPGERASDDEAQLTVLKKWGQVVSWVKAWDTEVP